MNMERNCNTCRYTIGNPHCYNCTNEFLHWKPTYEAMENYLLDKDIPEGEMRLLLFVNAIRHLSDGQQKGLASDLIQRLQKEEIEDWTKPDENDIIHVPDELDPLFNKIGMQLRFHTISGKNEMQTIAHMVYNAQKFFNSPIKPNPKLKEDLTQIRNNLYDNMPTGEATAWRLITVINEHLKKLDEYIDSN